MPQTACQTPTPMGGQIIIHAHTRVGTGISLYRPGDGPLSSTDHWVSLCSCSSAPSLHPCQGLSGLRTTCPLRRISALSLSLPPCYLQPLTAQRGLGVWGQGDPLNLTFAAYRAGASLSCALVNNSPGARNRGSPSSPGTSPTPSPGDPARLPLRHCPLVCLGPFPRAVTPLPPIPLQPASPLPPQPCPPVPLMQVHCIRHRECGWLG